MLHVRIRTAEGATLSMPAARGREKTVVIYMPKNALRNAKTVKIVYIEIRVKNGIQ